MPIEHTFIINLGRGVEGTTETTLTDFDNDDDDDDFGLDMNKSLSISPHQHNNNTTDGEGSGVDGNDHTPISDTWKFVGVGQEENTMVDTDSSSSSLPMLPTGLTNMSLS